ncbi:hypothetical protein JKP88DRAFT_261834 [Tribonema minus]|uniref:Uncharacterized protein n=1 Tax=Tribonema minus TaxID=303371 RepID=A0A835ZGX9_9STRA|nr:hypothetical protein JKP88DRAFT_261834 [Tribonema minus]
MVFVQALCMAVLMTPLLGTSAAGLTATCPNGKTCVETTHTVDAVCNKNSECRCKGGQYEWEYSSASCIVCFFKNCAEVCLATRGGGSATPAPKKCSKLLDCKKNTTACGHSRAGNYPTLSTTCCAADEQCSVDPDSGSAHKTKCTKLACAKGRQACGRVVSIFSGKYGAYLEQTPDDVCCAAGEECHFGYDNVSRCNKPKKCAKGHQSCGNRLESLALDGPYGDYYLPGFIYSAPDNVCCAADEKCEAVDPGGIPGYSTGCVKRGSS